MNFRSRYFRYEPKTIKLDAKSDTGQPIIETDRGQYLQMANDLQRMTHRECIIRRYQSEKLLDKYVLWVKQTKNTSANTSRSSERVERTTFKKARSKS